MQRDSLHCSTFGPTKESSNQVVTQEPQVKSYYCSKCPIIFKSKVYLFEHLNKVHCLNVEAALRGADLKFAERHKAITDDSKSPEEVLKCQLCDFTTFSQDVLTKHKKVIHKTENSNLTETVVVSEYPDIEMSELSPNQCSEVSEEEEGPYSESTSNSKCTPNSSRDLKIYTRPPQTTKFFTPASGSSEHFCAKLADKSNETLILQESSPTSTAPSWSGVCKVTATSLIDISHFSNNYLRTDQLMIPELRPTNPNDQSKEVQSNIGKRTTNDGLEGTSAKKFKSGKERTTLPEGKNADKQLSGSVDFSFEVSEDEGGKADGKEDQPNPKVYFCKHCDYSDRSFKCITSHYRNDHPHVRCNALYIQNSHDRSATFRCLECPNEFASSVDLKWHYTEKHPEAPDVFNVKLNQLSLVYKCFSCPFTTTELKALRKHYKEKHPTYEVDNSLLFCQYSVSKCQEEAPQVQTCQKLLSAEKPREQSPEKVVTYCEEVKDARSPQHPTCKEPVEAMYTCVKCEFRHKSAVVMHVHYKKKHPNKAVTIDKIKQLPSDTLHEPSQMLPETKSSQKAKTICEMSQQKKITVYLSKPTSEDSKRQPEFPTTKQVESVQDENTPSPSKPNRRITSGKDSLSSDSPGEMYYCTLCDYTSPQIKSVLWHHYAKHKYSTVTKQDIIQYSTDVRAKKLNSQSSSKARKGGKSRKSEARAKDGAVDSSVKGANAYANAENLFYCQKCNVGKPSIKGVLNHQVFTHESLNSNSEQVVQHTALICAKIKTAKSHGNTSFSSTYLPLPILNKGDEKMFFCDLCNFRQRSVTRVLRHYSNTHQGCSNKSAVIRQYTTRVLKQAMKASLKSATNHELQQNTDIKKKTADKLVKTPSDSAPLSVGDSGTQRNLKCPTCAYSTQCVSVLKSHMRKRHRSNRPVKGVLQMCFRQGALEAGYHCQWCIFSHQNAETIYKHCKESHPQRTISLEHVHTQLYVGPNSAHGGDDVDSSLASVNSRQNERETYSCPKCSYTSRSKSSLTRHKNEFHLGLDNILDPQRNKGASIKSQLEELNEMPGVFESFQAPLEETDEAMTSSTVSKYPSCPTALDSQRGPIPHPQKQLKPLKMQEQKKQAVNTKTLMHVFKCGHCNFISTFHKKILTHCHMRHPSLTSKVDGLYVDPAHLHDRDEYMRKNEAGENFKFSGYMCKTCPQIFASLDKLERHCKQKHNETLHSILKPTTKSSAKHCSTHESVSKASFFSKLKYAKVKCQHCAYFCNKRTSLSRHMQKEHPNTFSKDRVHKCMMCPQIFFIKNKLGKHYVKVHGKASLLKHFVPVYKQNLQKPTFQDNPSTPQEQNKSSEEKRLVYKCPRCAYIHVSYHGVLTHCQMKHPAFTARADKLQTCEIFVSNIVRRSTGKGAYDKGYQCKRCPQIYPSLAKLKAHISKHGNMAASDLSAETKTENPAVDNPPSSAYEPDPLKNKTPPENPTETTPSLCTSNISNSPSSQSKENPYKCQVCMYATDSRKYLRYHFQHGHKFNAVTVYKLLEKYNKRKRNYLPHYAAYKKGESVKCKMCPDLMFDSSQSLIDHYCNFHQLGCKSDFTVISFGQKYNSTGMYRCVHCMTQLNGIKKLCYHLDRHKAMLWVKSKRKKASRSVSASPNPQPIELRKQNDVPTFENMEELSNWSGAQVEAIVLPTSPLSSPAKVTEGELEAEIKKDQHSCKQCHRTFKSLKGLQSHEHGHAALAAIKKRDNLPELNQDIKGFVLYRMGNLKPFLCTCCTYRTNFMGLMQSHILKNHQDIIQKTKATVENNCEEVEIPQKEDEEPSESSEKTNFPELDDEPEETEESVYSEHEDVQRQLNHYSLMAQNAGGSNGKVLEWMRLENSHIYCEMCTFSTEHLSSIRRHYLNRHGKKLLKCKDCEFVTALRKTLELHIQMGHSTYQSEPTHHKNLHCPLCIYQTKNKNSMIDHIVLHREERVVPIEVRRPKLSRYLEGIVFRCHKCTFSSGIAENLDLHMKKHHNDVRPYRCRLCYFNCTQLTELEAHLCDKHQVLRNHELVGQVSLDQIDRSITNNQKVKNEEFAPDSDEIPQNDIDESDGEGKMFLPIEEIQVKQEWEENDESPADSSVSDFQPDAAQPNTAVLMIHEQNSQTHEVNVGLHHSAGGQHVGNAKQNFGACNVYEEEKKQARLTDKLKEEAAEEALLSFKMEEDSQEDMLHFKEIQQKTQSGAATFEDDKEHRVLQLDEDSSKSHEWENQDLTIKMEQNIEAKGKDINQSEDTDQSDKDLSDNTVLDQEGSTTFTQKPEVEAITNSVSANMSNAQADGTKSQGGLGFEKNLRTSPDSLSVLLPSCEPEQEQTPTICKDALGPCGERPVVENESHKGELDLMKCKEEEETDHLEEKQEEKDEMMTEDEARCKEQDVSNIYDEESMTADGAAEVLHDDKLFTCHYCGRNLMNGYELNRHIMRHGL